MSSLMQNTEVLAHQLFGPEAEVLTKHEEGRVQWWVRDPQKKLAIASETLRDLHDALEQKAKIQMAEANGDLITSAEASKILGYGSRRVLALVKMGILSAQYVPGPGQGHRQTRFRRAQVEALKDTKPTPGHAWPQNKGKEKAAKPKSNGSEPLLTSKQIAHVIGMKPTSIPGAVRDYGMPTAARGAQNRLLFRESDVKEWASKRERKAPSRKPAVVQREKASSKTRRIVVDISIGTAIRLEQYVERNNQPPFTTSARAVVEHALETYFEGKIE